MPRLTESRYEENFPGSNYTDEEREFLQAMDRYKRMRQRPFPTWREVLRVFKQLGYRKVAAAEAEKKPPGATPPPPAA
jgi:hypothetical protein